MVIASEIPNGRPKSGRFWKTSRNRTSSTNRQGVMKHLGKTYEEKEIIRAKKLELKETIKEVKEQKERKKAELIAKKVDREKRKAANEMKNNRFQEVVNLFSKQ